MDLIYTVELYNEVDEPTEPFRHKETDHPLKSRPAPSGNVVIVREMLKMLNDT